ncbi:MAG: hypothetical protein WBP81_13410 [Solirubrobacteraceae bacterium]
MPGELAILDRERPVVFVSGTGRKATDAVDAFRSVGMVAYAVEGAWAGGSMPGCRLSTVSFRTRRHRHDPLS